MNPTHYTTYQPYKYSLNTPNNSPVKTKYMQDTKAYEHQADESESEEEIPEPVKLAASKPIPIPQKDTPATTREWGDFHFGD